MVENFYNNYYVIYIEEKNYERLINAIRRKKLFIWNINKVDNGIELYIGKEDYENNKDFFSEYHVCVRKKHGIKFKIKKMFMRIGFIIGGIFAFVYIVLYSFFLWDIEVIGNVKIDKKEIIEYLLEKNVKPPIKNSKMTRKYVEWLINKKYDIFKFVEVYSEGTKLVISLKEVNDTEYEKFDKSPSSIISNKQAVVCKAVVKNGQLVVSEGSVVNKGDTLIQGIKKDKTGERILTNSIGNVYGYTYYKFSLEEPIMYKFRTETGNKKSITEIITKNKQFKIFSGKNKYNEYDVKVKQIKIPIISDIFNIYIRKTYFYEVELVEKEIPEEYAKNKMFINLYEKVVKSCNKNAIIYKKDIIFDIKDDKYVLNARIEMIEDIGEKVEIQSIGEAQ